jgi:hypothetical protein
MQRMLHSSIVLPPIAPSKTRGSLVRTRSFPSVSSPPPIYLTAANVARVSLRDREQAVRLRRLYHRQEQWTPWQMRSYLGAKHRHSDVFHARPRREDYQEARTVGAFVKGIRDE